jgi:hypothetical protein
MSLSPISVLLWGSLSIKKACRRPYTDEGGKDRYMIDRIEGGGDRSLRRLRRQIS